jgi:hypothetical protein
MAPITLDTFVSLSKRKKKAILERVAAFANREQAKVVRKVAVRKKKA